VVRKPYMWRRREVERRSQTNRENGMPRQTVQAKMGKKRSRGKHHG